MNFTQQHKSFLKVFNISLALLLSLSVISLFIFYLFWTYPLADDLYQAAVVRDFGLFRMLWLDYLVWSGRWVGVGLDYLIPYLGDIVEVYPWILLCWVLIQAISFCLFAALLFDIPFTSKFSFFVGILLYALFLANLPSLREGLYWLTGATENMLALAVSVTFFYFFFSSKRLLNGIGRVFWIPLLCLCAFVLPGFNELYGLVFCLVLAVSLGVAVARKRSHKFVSLAVTLCAILGLIFVVAAPGNYSRLEVETHGKVTDMNLLENAIGNLPLAMGLMMLRLKEWILSPSLLIASLMVVLCPSIAGIRPRWYENDRVVWSVLVPLTFLIGVFLCFWTMVSTIGGVPERTLNGIYGLFFLGWFATLFVNTRKMMAFRIFQKDLSITFLICFLYLSVYHQPNIGWALRDLTKAPVFYQEMLLREDAIRSAVSRGVTEIEVPEVTHWPEIFPRHMDLVEDPRDFRSFDWAIYFKAEKVKQKRGMPDIGTFAREPEGKSRQGFGSSE